jgi:hypothetical protein
MAAEFGNTAKGGGFLIVDQILYRNDRNIPQSGYGNVKNMVVEQLQRLTGVSSYAPLATTLTDMSMMTWKFIIYASKTLLKSWQAQLLCFFAIFQVF